MYALQFCSRVADANRVRRRHNLGRGKLYFAAYTIQPPFHSSITTDEWTLVVRFHTLIIRFEHSVWRILVRLHDNDIFR